MNNVIERVTNVVARDDLHLELTFHNGEKRLFDARPYLHKGGFVRLQKPQLFKQAYVDFDTVCWPGELDIAPETLYDKSVSLTPSPDGREVLRETAARLSCPPCHL